MMSMNSTFGYRRPVMRNSQSTWDNNHNTLSATRSTSAILPTPISRQLRRSSPRTRCQLVRRCRAHLLRPRSARELVILSGVTSSPAPGTSALTPSVVHTLPNTIPRRHFRLPLVLTVPHLRRGGRIIAFFAICGDGSVPPLLPAAYQEQAERNEGQKGNDANDYACDRAAGEAGV